jgi:curli biogenesis system outer membrane secretion channel CsgG
MKMKLLFLSSLYLLAIYGCGSSSHTLVKDQEQGIAKGRKTEVLNCTRPVEVKITVNKVNCSSANCQPMGGGSGGAGGIFALLQMPGMGSSFDGIGNGLKDMFSSSLQKVGCFKVMDREAMEAIQNELKLSGKSDVKMEAADYIVMGSVTSINMENEHGSGSAGYMGFFGSSKKMTQKATMAMDVRLVNVKTGQIDYSRTYNAESDKKSYDVSGGGSYAGFGFSGNMGGLSGTAMEEVARDIIIKATYDIVGKLVPPDQISRKLVSE